MRVKSKSSYLEKMDNEDGRLDESWNRALKHLQNAARSAAKDAASTTKMAEVRRSDTAVREKSNPQLSRLEQTQEHEEMVVEDYHSDEIEVEAVEEIAVEEDSRQNLSFYQVLEMTLNLSDYFRCEGLNWAGIEDSELGFYALDSLVNDECFRVNNIEIQNEDDGYLISVDYYVSVGANYEAGESLIDWVEPEESFEIYLAVDEEKEPYRSRGREEETC